MNEKEIQRRKEKARRQTIYFRNGKLIPPSSETKRTICNVHLILAREINNLRIPDETKERLLTLVNEVYNFGKRMDNKLDIYKSKLGDL